MKKNIIILSVLLSSAFAFAQVGVNTSDPKATFDITAKDPKGTSRNPEGLLVPRVDRERAQSMIGTSISTLIYVDDVSTGLQTGTTINIDNIGYYYFDGMVWVKLNTPSIINPLVNIYNSDGVLTSDRIVDQEDKTIAFTGTATNAFSVDGNTFSVDAANNRVGIGTPNPMAKVDVIGDTFGIRRAIGGGSWDNLWFDIGSYGPSINASGAESGIDFKVGSNAVGTYGDSGQVLTTVATMRPNGNVGIGTTTPNVNAILELNATNKGFLPPRLTTAQRNAIPAASRPAGLMVYNTTTNCMDFWNSSAWVSTCAVAVPPAGTITGVTCTSATNTGTLARATVASGVVSVIPYTGGNGGSHGGQTVNSTGVTGLTATLSAGSFATGAGNLTYTITGTPSAVGNANFAINIGGRTCTLTRAVVQPPATLTSLDCATATNNGTLTGRSAASGVSSIIPYTGGNGGAHNGQTVASTGVTGLTATLSAGTLANGAGNLTYTITGTPNASGTANFAINIGGRTCTLTRTVAGAATPPAADNSAVCTGWALPYRGNGGVSSTIMNGETLNATFTSWGAQSKSAQTLCGVSTTGGSAFGFNSSQGNVNIKFNKAVSNLKVSHLTVNSNGNHDVLTYTFKKNGVTLSAVTRTTIGMCGTLNSYTWTAVGHRISRNASDGYNYAGTTYNFGGIWFDEVAISASNASGTVSNFASELSFCIGSVQ